MSRTKTIIWAVAMGLWSAGCGGSGGASSAGTEAPEAAQEAQETAGDEAEGVVGDPADCSQAWYEKVEATIHVADEDGHGPDVGSDEWMQAVEMRMGQLGEDLPTRGTPPWCERVHEWMRSTSTDYE